MAFTPVPAGIEVTVQGNRGADKRINVYHVQNVSGDPMSSAVPEVGGIFGAWVLSSYRAGVTSVIGFDKVTARDISVADGIEYVFDCGNATGLLNSDPLPGNVCPLLSFHTGHGGRRGRGRIFHFEPTENELVASRFDPTYINAIVTSLNALRTALDFTTYPLAVYSRKSNALYPITSVTGSLDIATQRDRLPGRRAHRRPRANPA